MNLTETTQYVQQLVNRSEALDTAITFVFAEEAGIIHLDGRGASNVITNHPQAADCTVHLSLENFNKLLDGSLNPMEGLMTGKIVLDGDMAAALKLGNLFQ